MVGRGPEVINPAEAALKTNGETTSTEVDTGDVLVPQLVGTVA